MQHVDEGLLTAYADGQLDASSARHIVAHVQGCVECQAQLAEIQRTSEQAKSILAGSQVSGKAAPTFADVLARAQRARPRNPWYVRPVAWAASLAIVSGVMWYSFKGMGMGSESRATANRATAFTPTATRPAASGPAAARSLASGQGARHEGGVIASSVDIAAEVPKRDTTANRPMALPLATEPVRPDSDAASKAESRADQVRVNAGAGGAGQASQAAPPPSAPTAALRMQRAASPLRDAVDTTQVYQIEGLPIVSRTRLGDTVRTVQQVDSTLTIELTQEVVATPPARRRGQPAADVLSVTVSDSGVAVIEKGRYRITAKAALSADSLRALLLKLK